MVHWVHPAEEQNRGRKQLDEVENTEKSKAGKHKHTSGPTNGRSSSKKGLGPNFSITDAKLSSFFNRHRTRRDALLQVRRTFFFHLSCRPAELNPALPSASLPPMKQGQTLCGGNFNYHLDALH